MSPAKGRDGMRGSIAVEFALVLPVLLYVMVALAGVTQYTLVRIQLEHAALLGQIWSARGAPPRAVEEQVCLWFGQQRPGGTCHVVLDSSPLGTTYRVQTTFRFAAPLLHRLSGGGRVLEATWVGLTPDESSVSATPTPRAPESGP